MNSPAQAWERGSGWGRGSGQGAPQAPCVGTSSNVTTGRATVVAARIWQLLSATCWRIWAAIESRRVSQRRRSLRVVESVGMGEKRFVAIVQVEEQRFLVGGGTAGVSLLAKLDAAPEFAAVLDPQQVDSESLLAANRIREAW